MAKPTIATFVAPLCCAVLTFLFPSRTRAEGTIEKVQIADGIYQFITSPDGYVPNGNSIVIINQNHVLVFDTFTRPSTARRVLAEIRKLTPKPVRGTTSYLNLELKLLESIVEQVTRAVQKGLVTVDNVQKEVSVEDLRPQFTHGDPDLDKKFRRFAKGMVKNGYREARDGKKFD